MDYFTFALIAVGMVCAAFFGGVVGIVWMIETLGTPIVEDEE